MASFQDEIRVYLQNKLNNTTNNPLVDSETTFRLYNRYEIEEQDFFEFVVDSIDWQDAPLFTPQFQNYTINTDFVGLGALNDAGESVKVPNVLYEFTAGSTLAYYIWDNVNKKYALVDRFTAPYNTYTINGDFDRLSTLEAAGEVYYRYMWWDENFNNGPGQPTGKYVEIDITQAPYNTYIINTEFDFLNALISLGEAEQRPLTVYRLLIENILWEVANPFDLDYVEFNPETDSFELIDQSKTPIFTTFTAKDNVVINYEGQEYNTQLGQYTLRQVKYIPCIIENFLAEFEPLKFIRNVNYTIPLTFYVNETFNRKLENKIIEAVEVFQDKIRGHIELVYGHNTLFNHSDITPLTGIIDFNGTIFREYQMIIYLEAVKSVPGLTPNYSFYGNQIEYRITVPHILTNYRVYPLSAMATRGNELHMFQKFSTPSNNEFEAKSIPNESGFSLELAFLYYGDSFSKWLYQMKYAQTELPVITLQVKYPGIAGDTVVPYEKEYLIESIGGAESVGDKIIFTLVLRPVSEVYA